MPRSVEAQAGPLAFSAGVREIRIHAPPVDGAANEELLRFLAERLGIPRSGLRLLAGESSRRKRVAVTGGPPDPERQLLARSPR